MIEVKKNASKIN